MLELRNLSSMRVSNRMIPPSESGRSCVVPVDGYLNLRFPSASRVGPLRTASLCDSRRLMLLGSVQEASVLVKAIAWISNSA